MAEKSLDKATLIEKAAAGTMTVGEAADYAFDNATKDSQRTKIKNFRNNILNILDIDPNMPYKDLSKNEYLF